MKEPVRVPSPAAASEPRPSAPASKPTRRKRPRRSARPRGKVPGGKALARMNMLLAQRGIAPEPKPPEPPVLGGVPTPKPPPGAASRERASAAAELLEGYRELRAQLARAQPARGRTVPTWLPLGPFYMPHGQSYGSGRGSRPPVAGRVAAIAVDPTDDQHVLCGAGGGGIWETRDGGRTWAPRGDDQPSLSIGALAFDPSDARRAYAGTGEGNSAESDTTNVRAAGLLRSDDGGTTWAPSPDTSLVGISFYDLVVDPTDGRHLLAATTDGIYESTDRGTSWTRRRGGVAWSVSMHPPVAGNPAASREVLAGTVDGVLRSTDGGTTWRAVALPGTNATFAPERVVVDHAPSNGSIAYAFAAGNSKVKDLVASEEEERTVLMPRPYLWRRETFGGAFAEEQTPDDLQTGQAWYDWFAAVAPNNHDVVYVGGINAHRGERQADDGWRWTNISAKRPDGDSIHPDQHAIAFSPSDPNVVFIGSDGGLYRSPDAGRSWQPLNKGLCITEIEFLAQHPTLDAWLLAGTQDNGTIRYEGQEVWYHVQDGDGGDCAVDQDQPYTCYHSFYGPALERSLTGGGWNEWDGLTGNALNNEDALFYPPLDVNGALVVRGASRVWLSRDAGASWRAVTLPGVDGFVSAVTAASRTRVYAGSESGQLYRLDWSAPRWTVRPLTPPGEGYLSEVLVDPSDDAVLWCAVNQGGRGTVYRSTDGGVTWAVRSTGLPRVSIHALEIDAARPATLFAATDVGVCRTDDAGGRWAAFGRGLPNVLVKDLLVHPTTRLLRAGTQARGVWEIPVDAGATPAVQLVLRDHAADRGRTIPSTMDVPNPFARGSRLFWWQSPDVKIDASPFCVPDLDGLDVDLFADDRSKREDGIEFAAGLIDERPVRGQRVRVYVQVHNRGHTAAERVAVRAFFVPGGVTLPSLPAGFWNAFPNNVVPAGARWQPVAPHRVVRRIAPGRAAVVGFEWTVPSTLGSAVALLAVASAARDPITDRSLDVGSLVRSSRHCALRNFAVINPSPIAGPSSHTIVVDAWRERGARLTLDRQARRLVRGLVLGPTLAAEARRARWAATALTDADLEHLTRAADARPELRPRLRRARSYLPTPQSDGLDLSRLAARASEPIVLLLRRATSQPSGSLLVHDADDAPIGGLTIVNLRGARED